MAEPWVDSRVSSMVVSLVVLMDNETAGQWVVTTAVARAGSMASYWAVRKVWK